MQPEESIQIKHGLAWNIYARPHRVILRLTVRHHNVQPVGRPALKNHDQPLGAGTRLSRAHGCTSEKAGYRRRADDGERTVAKKNPTSNGHEKAAPSSQPFAL